MVAPAAQRAPLSAALAIFVKTPGLSPIKTRLARSIGVEAAIEFHRCAAAAVAAVARAAIAQGVDLTPYWVVAEADAIGHAAWRGFPTVWQGTGKLADRLEQVHDELRARHGRVLLIGADAPQITTAQLAAALAALDDPATPFALGRACDGGFWLLASRAEIPRHVWQAVNYSQPGTAGELASALGTLGNVAALSELTDADTADDLPRLQSELEALPAALPEQRAVCAWIASLPRRGNR
jgi:hypothetical protein